jgi:hypothetical protein
MDTGCVAHAITFLPEWLRVMISVIAAVRLFQSPVSYRPPAGAQQNPHGQRIMQTDDKTTD